MAAPQFTLLPHRAFVVVQGDDRFSFLQGMVSNDVTRVEAGQAVWAAFLTPQGKFLHEFFMAPGGDHILLECERARRDDLVTRLSRYRLRAKVSLTGDDKLTPGVAWGDGIAARLEVDGLPGRVRNFGAGLVYADPRLPGAGVRLAVAANQTADLTALGLRELRPESYDQVRLALGLPDGSRDMEVEKALLLENGFEELNGVDFAKGCYIGQELTARTHYRALIKKRLMPVSIEGAAPAAGATITAADGSEVGEMKSAAGGIGLALLRLDKKDGLLHAGSARLTAQSPAWMKTGSEA